MRNRDRNKEKIEWFVVDKDGNTVSGPHRTKLAAGFAKKRGQHIVGQGR